jgi:hypothetical protein
MTEHILPELPCRTNPIEPRVSSEVLDRHYNGRQAGYIEKLNRQLPGGEFELTSRAEIIPKSRAPSSTIPRRHGTLPCLSFLSPDGDGSRAGDPAQGCQRATRRGQGRGNDHNEDAAAPDRNHSGLNGAAILAAEIPYTASIRHPDQKRLAAYLIFVNLFVASAVVFFSPAAWLATRPGMVELEQPEPALAFLALRLVPANALTTWQTSSLPLAQALPARLTPCRTAFTGSGHVAGPTVPVFPDLWKAAQPCA